MKKNLFLLLLIVPFLLMSCPDDGGSSDTSVKSVTLDITSLTLTVGKTGKLTATVSPATATNRAVSWSTSNAAVATVSAGTVTAVAEGTATITVTARDGGKHADCAVTIEPRPITDIGAKDSMSGKTVQEYFAEKNVYIGWNLGNALDAGPGEGSWTPMIIPEIFTGIKEAGFSAVRIPITWVGTDRSIGAAPNYQLDQPRLNRVAEVVDMAYAAGLVTIINIHHDGSGRNNWLSVYNAALDVDGAHDRITAQYTKVWEQIAAKFRDYGDWLIFEAFNELHNGGWGWGEINPDEFDVINEWNQVFTNTVRASGGNNAERFLIIQPYCAKPHQAINDTFVLPTDTTAGKQIVSMHYYDPESFALRPNANGSNAEWGSEGDKQEIVYGRSGYVGFNDFKEKFTDKGIPVIIGECGAVYQPFDDPALEAKAHASRIAYLDYMCSQAKAHGLIPVYWDNGTITAGGEKFGLFNRATGNPLPEMLDIIETMINAVQ